MCLQLGTSQSWKNPRNEFPPHSDIFVSVENQVWYERDSCLVRATCLLDKEWSTYNRTYYILNCWLCSKIILPFRQKKGSGKTTIISFLQCLLKIWWNCKAVLVLAFQQLNSVVGSKDCWVAHGWHFALDDTPVLSQVSDFESSLVDTWPDFEMLFWETKVFDSGLWWPSYKNRASATLDSYVLSFAWQALKNVHFRPLSLWYVLLLLY